MVKLMTPKRWEEISTSIQNILQSNETYGHGANATEQMLFDVFENMLKIDILVDTWRAKSEGYSVLNTTWDDAADSLQCALHD
jgi:hypothetical protein